MKSAYWQAGIFESVCPPIHYPYCLEQTQVGQVHTLDKKIISQGRFGLGEVWAWIE